MGRRCIVYPSQMNFHSSVRIKPLHLVQIKLHLSNHTEFLKPAVLPVRGRKAYIQEIYLIKSSLMKKEHEHRVWRLKLRHIPKNLML